MRFNAVFAAFAVIATGVTAQTPEEFSVTSDLISSALTFVPPHYGSPQPPWVPDARPGWYFGNHTPPFGIFWLEGLLCKLLDLLPGCLKCPHKPHKPHNPPEYKPTYYNLTCASQDDSFMTFGLVDTVDDCQDMCDSVPGCTFANSEPASSLEIRALNLARLPAAFHDNNATGKGNSTMLTCSLFSKCLGESSADNCGGQGQPDGSIEFITESSGYCKKKATV
ncbi:hypothetical protein MKEN_00431300 [Mycena kentingensis (nom. inval.)]|nr:hypothetical protein MKEN_00431300 [Mycena kentingensis (nom. inval.)]